MELGLVIVIVVVMVWYGLFNSVETGARMANKEMEKFEDEQTLRHDEWYKDVTYTEEDSVKIDDARTYFRSRRK